MTPSKVRTMKINALIVIASIILSPLTQASSPDAWDEFRYNVSAACTTVAEETLSDVQLNVDPFGSENQGIAVVFGRLHQTKAPMIYVCLYDKRSQQASLFAESMLTEFHTLSNGTNDDG